jgi:hypothetical protein
MGETSVQANPRECGRHPIKGKLDAREFKKDNIFEIQQELSFRSHRG